MPAPRIATRLIALMSRFAGDSQANLAVIFAIALLPILAAVGCATEYSLADQMKARMQAAADAASLASISRNSPGYLAASQMTSDGPVPAGVIDANNVFKGTLGAAGGDDIAVTSTVIKSGAMLISNVRFSAEVPTAFMKLVGSRSLTVSGSSTASAGIPIVLNNMASRRTNTFVVRNGVFTPQNRMSNQAYSMFNQARMAARIVK